MKPVALITGGSRGIGFGIASALAKAGYDLAINGVRSEEEAGPHLKLLGSYNADVMYCQGDIGSPGDRQKIVDETLTHYKRINVLVNNAGVAPYARMDILDLDEVNYDRLLDLNLKGTFFLTQLVARHMIEAQSQANAKCSIITISSISATVASINRGEYCISKAGLAMMTKLFAVRMAQHNVDVYEVRPGIIATDMTSGVKKKYDDLIESGLTLENRWGTPEDVGKAVTALATGQIPYGTGQVIEISGGMGIERL